MSIRKIAIVAGGPSSEAAVSYKSAEGVAAALQSVGFTTETFELGPQLAEQLAAANPDAVFPVAHGPVGEDGCLQGLLEVLDLPYVGSDVRASAVAAHKPTAKQLFRAAGLPVSDERWVRRGESLAAAIEDIRDVLGESVVVKPAAGGSAIGVTRLPARSSDAELMAALELALASDPGALVERFVDGAEVTCGVLDVGGRVQALPPTLVRSTASSWYDFRARYQAGGSEHECPARLPRAVYDEVQRCAVGAHCAVGARDLSRVDFVVGEEELVVLEVNTLPGMTSTSNYPEAAAVWGVSFGDLCRRFVQAAMDRPRRVAPPVEQIPES